MKKVSIILAGIFAATMLHAATNIYVVNMGEVYSNYYKAKEAAAQIKTSVDATNAELEKMNKERQDLMKKIQDIQTKAQNPALAEDAKRKIVETEAQPVLVQIRQIEQNMENMRRSTAQKLQENAAGIRKVHMQEISEIIKAVAKEKKADFIVEKSVCYFSKPEADITQDVIKAVNATGSRGEVIVLAALRKPATRLSPCLEGAEAVAMREGGAEPAPAHWAEVASALRISQNFFRNPSSFWPFREPTLCFFAAAFLSRPTFRFRSASQRMKKYASIAIDIAASVIIPGFGLFLQKRWGEAAAFFFSSALAFLIMPPAAYFIWICGIYYTARGTPENPHAR